MVQFLLTTSLVLHLLTFLWIITLLQKVNNQQISPINDEKIKREIEDLLVAYTTEMKEENEKLLEQVKMLQEANTSPVSLNEKVMEQLKVEHEPIVINSKEAIKEDVTQRHTVDQYKYEDYQPPTIQVDEPDMYEQSNTAKVLLLAEQGFSSEEIAKKLSLGKGEVELMIKFYR
ncbi:hypothetical protein BTR23_05445 [Alkalihalophilus pseudofirmus]|nr:hypothetical protein BTR23_05445 [Alkalihalophilus pseudofirmus]